MHISSHLVRNLKFCKSRQELADIHERLMKGYKKVVEVNRNGKRLLGTYFRVAFYGAMFGDEDGKEYIYKVRAGDEFYG